MYRRFFAELAPRLDTARALEAELDRHLARRFNVFDYAKTDELGISRILADLLDPDGPHGQGTLFLERFVKGLENLRNWPDLRERRISVDVEHVIRGNRRIDIYVEIGGAKAAHCLAIENKPYAEDQNNQIKDYLAHLSKRHPGRFMLIYLSPRGEGPSSSSLPKNELAKSIGQFAILSYCKYDGVRDHNAHENLTDEFRNYRLSGSLADWFRECRRVCEVDRLRWFLRDAELFCQREFGVPDMTIDSETKLVTDFVLSEPENNIEIAYTVYKSWPVVREKICGNFLDLIRCQVKKKVSEFADDIQVNSKYGGKHPRKFRIWLYRKSWTQFKVGDSGPGDRIAVCMEVGESANGWYFGIASPLSVGNMTNGDKKQFEGLKEELRNYLGSGKEDSRWLWWKYVEDPRYGYWESQVLNLYREKEKGGDKVVKYFVDLLVNTAEKAITVIDKFDSEYA